VSQRKYTLDILRDTGMIGAKPCCFPMEQNHQLTSDSGTLLPDPSEYRRLIGRLIYLTITRPDITYPVQILSQFMQQPREPHMAATHRVLRYLKGSPGYGILMSRSAILQVQAYCDSDWAACPTMRRSVTGFVTFLGTSPISWRSKKQSVVSRSSAEAEYHSMANTVCELTWLQYLLQDFIVPHCQPMILHCDNQAAIHIASNPVFHERTKHIELDCHLVREKIQSGLIATRYVSTSDQRVDIFTKALGQRQFHYLLGKLGVLNLHTPSSLKGGIVGLLAHMPHRDHRIGDCVFTEIAITITKERYSNIL
jgi:hypothetical protein